MARFSGAAFVPLLVASFVMLAMAVFASDADVNIYNGMSDGESLRVNCRKYGKSGDFGEKTLLPGEHFGWGFTPSIFGVTKYSSHFQWHNVWADFEVWSEPRIAGTTITYRECTHCVWTVKQDGFYRNENGRRMVFVYNWH